MFLSEIESKDVINVVDGKKVGCVIDLDIEINSGQIITMFIQPYSGLLSIFKRDDRIIVPWDQIIKIGQDVIIVNLARRC